MTAKPPLSNVEPSNVQLANGSLRNLLWTNSNPRPDTICHLCRSMIGTVWVPGTEPPLPLHPRCYCTYWPTDLPASPNEALPDPTTMPPATKNAWIRYVAYLLRKGLDIVPWLLFFLAAALAYNEANYDKDGKRKDKKEKDPMPNEPKPQSSALPPSLSSPLRPSAGGGGQGGVRSPTGKVLLTPSDRGRARREYLCHFIAAGTVKQADQQASDWLIPADAIRAAEHLFQARPSYIDHPDLFGFGWHQDPSVARLIGVTSDPKWDEDLRAMTGTLRLYDQALGSPGHLVGTLFDQILDDQANGLTVPPIGLSAVFYHTSHLDEHAGLRVTDEIGYVESVDVVYDPGAAGYIKQALSALRPASFFMSGIQQPISTLQEAHPMSETPVTYNATPDPNPAPPLPNSPAPQLPPAPAPVQAALDPAPATPAGSSAPPPPGSPASANPPGSPDPLDRIASRLDEMQNRIELLSGVLAHNQEGLAVTGMEFAGQPAVRGGLGSLERVEAALEAMLNGVRPPHGIQPLTGIRELYTLLSGDYEMNGLFHPDRIYLANVTSSTMAGLVANALNKRVINMYQTYPKWWESAVTIEDFATLQQVKWITLGGIGELPTVAEGAAYTEMTWDDQTETADFVKKGGYLGITLEAIDKDDTRKLQAAPRALAQAAWLTLGKTIAALFTCNSAYGSTMSDGNCLFDSSNHSNVGTTAFSHTAWVATKLAMMKFTELNSGERLAGLMRPRLLWVPVDLEDVAIAELASGEGQIGSADYNINAAAYADSLTERLNRAKSRVISVPFWTDTADWVVQADPALYPGLGLGFRYGRSPEVFSVASPTAGLMFTNDTMPIKVRFFFAVTPTDWRAWYKHLVT